MSGYDYELSDEDQQHEREMKRLYSAYPVLKPNVQLELAQRYLDGDEKAGEKLLKHSLRLVANQAHKHIGKGLPLGDLFQEGMMGFMKGLGKFDPAKGFKVTTYTTWWIRQGITRAIENKGKMIRIPSHKQQQANKVKWAYKQFLSARPDEGSNFDKAAPDAKDLLEFCDLTIEQIKESNKFLQTHVSLSQTSGEDDQLTLADYVAADSDHQPEEQVERMLDNHYLMGVLDKLEQAEKDFIVHRFGFLDGVEKNKRQMSQFTKLPPNQNQLQEDAILEKLRKLIDLEKMNNGSR